MQCQEMLKDIVFPPNIKIIACHTYDFNVVPPKAEI